MNSLGSPVPQRSFAAPQQLSGFLDGEATGALIAATTDISLIVNGRGVIEDATFETGELGNEGVEGWLGRRLVDTVTVESRPKIDALLRDASIGTISRWRQVNHPSPTGIDLPIRYAAIRSKKGAAVLLLGKDLRAVSALQKRLADTQQALEREYERLRAAETRYKLLFQLGSEPVLVVDAGTRRVTDVNPAAARRLGRPQRRLVGQDVVDLFDAASTRDLHVLFAGLRVTGQAADLAARLAQGRGETRISASLFRTDQSTSVLIRLSPDLPEAGPVAATSASALGVLAYLPEGFVVTDTSRKILTANTAFLDLAQLATEEQVRGEPLERWLGRSESEVQVLFATLQDHGSVRHFATSLRGEYGSMEEVEIAAVAVAGGDQPCLGFTIRSQPRRHEAAPSPSRVLPRSIEQMTELVGRVSMKTLVRESTDLIEKLCIEAALRITRDNRASAAEMLGLSRQGLYAKMRRYGIGDLDSLEPEPS